MRKRRLAAAALSACIAGLLLPGCAAFEGDSSDPTVQQQRQQGTAAPDTVASARKTAAPTATRQGRSVEARIEAASRAARIKMALVEERSLRTFDFEPRVTGGRVTLAGNVATRAQGRMAAQVAREVEGIDDVRNRLTVAGEPVAWNKPAPNEPSPKDQRVASSRQGATRGGGGVHHTVEPGESLWTIADRYGTTVGRLKALNDLRSGGIRAGERLRVEPSAPSRAARMGAGKDRGNAPLSFYKGGASNGNTREPAAGSENEAAEYYVVKRGESLWTIAQKNGMSVARLKELNGLASNSLMPGDRLRVE